MMKATPAQIAAELARKVTDGTAPLRLIHAAHRPRDVWEAVYPNHLLDAHNLATLARRLDELGWTLVEKGYRLEESGYVDVLRFTMRGVK